MISDPDVIGLLYLAAIVCFIVALRFLSSPKHARKGNWVGGAGMTIAIATTLLLDGIGNWPLIAGGAAIGTVVGRRRGADREDDRDAADGGPLQRGRRRSCGTGRPRRVPRRGRRPRQGGVSSRSPSPRSSARSRSRARSSPSRSCRSSSPDARSSSPDRSSSTPPPSSGRQHSAVRSSPAPRRSGCSSPCSGSPCSSA